MKYKELAIEMYRMVNSGQSMEAFEKFYHEDSSMIESTGEVRQGKDTSREFEKNYLSSVKARTKRMALPWLKPRPM